MPRITRKNCEGAVGRLAKLLCEELRIEYSGVPQRPRLAFADDRWFSPRLPTGQFYEWVHAAIAGIEAFTQARR